MSTVQVLPDDALPPRAQAVFDDIRATRRSDRINNFWRVLAAADVSLLESTWAEVKRVLAGPGALDPLTRELIYIAVSAANGCGYCVHSHTAAARARGMSDEQYAELLAVIALAARTNQLATALQVPIDAAFDAAAR